MIEVVNLAEKFALFSDHWRPRIVGELNGQQVKLARIEGEFIWHHVVVFCDLYGNKESSRNKCNISTHDLKLGMRINQLFFWLTRSGAS